MPVPLKDVKGLLESPPDFRIHGTSEHASAVFSGIKLMLAEYGKRQIGLNREKLADIMLGQYNDRFDLADAIIAAEAQLIELKG